MWADGVGTVGYRDVRAVCCGVWLRVQPVTVRSREEGGGYDGEGALPALRRRRSSARRFPTWQTSTPHGTVGRWAVTVGG